MTRVAVLTLVASLGLATPVFAADSVLATATRLTREASHRYADAQKGRSGATLGKGAAAPVAPTRASRGSGVETQDQAPGMLQAGMSKSKKILIGVVIAAAVTGVVYAIDHGVDDNTPSSQGLR